ncbi:VCBS repeat-containing protein [candidate division KSB1 bacterium]|nr:VCBS repeat-containing protein [candidate division KSB1 bacterium]
MQKSNGVAFIISVLIITFLLSVACTSINTKSKLERIKYNNPGLHVDLGVGLWAWPLPMDYDGDGDFDLLVSCVDKPYFGMYFFENIGGNKKMPVFKPSVKVGPGINNIQVSYVDGQVRLLSPGQEITNFKEKNFGQQKQIYPTDKIHQGKVRANQWKFCDYEGDGDLDLIVGIGDGKEYGWDNAYNSNGEWMNGPIHGFVYLIQNNGTTNKPEYEEPVKIEAGGKPVDVYGMPTPNFADFDNDGDLDLLCGEFIDKFTYFENIGSRMSPTYSKGVILKYENEPIKMDLEMIVPVAFDWDKDGDVDLIVGEEDGRVSFVENTGKVINGVPQFFPPKYFRQQAADVKFGALVTPVSFDWDNDGDEDLICGNTAGYIGFIENLDGGNPPKWAEPKYLQAEGKVIRIQAGYNGSIQGPCEAKWGYTTLNVADWDGDGLPDIVVNSIWGKILWYRNFGTLEEPMLIGAQAIKVDWQGDPPKPEWNWWNPKGNNLVIQWRTTPAVIDLNKDGLTDLVMLDHEGYLAFFERIRKNEKSILLPGKRIFETEGSSIFDNKQRSKNTQSGVLQLNNGTAGSSGRRKLCFVDWDLDGKLDLLVNSVNINFMRNVSTGNDTIIFQDMGEVTDHLLAGHTTSPTIVDWDKNNIPDLLIGAEDGFFYFMKNPLNKKNQK